MRNHDSLKYVDCIHFQSRNLNFQIIESNTFYPKSEGISWV
jgi:hypothetical protein